MNDSYDRAESQTISINHAQLRISIAVVSSYFFKATVKIVSGILLLVPPLIADGIHGIIDIFEHGALVLAGRHARKVDREKYPLDREPLIDLMGLGIFLGLFFVGLSFFREAILSITAVLEKANLIGFKLPIWIKKYLPELDVPDINVLWTVALILFMCYGVTEIVYRFQLRLAKEHGLREMEADAMELRSDGWLELSMGIGFLTGWIATLLISKSSYYKVSNDINSLITGIILLALSVYLIKITIPEMYEKYQNLMNVALNSENRNELENIIATRIPDRCAILRPLTTFFRGEQLFITGYISIDRSVMVSADIILSKAERTAKRFLSNLNKDIRVQLSPFFVWDQESIDLDLNRALSLIWSVSEDCSSAKAFHQLRKGRIDGALKLISSYHTTIAQESALADYVKAEGILRIQGALHSETRTQMIKIRDLIIKDLSLSTKIILASWLLFYSVYRSENLPEKQYDIIEARNQLSKLLTQNIDIPDIVRAEAEFALGFSWERSHKYDLKMCAEHYRKAEIFYARSGIRSESDRLMNSWGHMETLLYALGDAQEHLELALEIRKLRGDPLSLSFTYGCLGDLYSRLGDFTEADHCYTQDLDLLNNLGIRHQIPVVMCKQGESRIRGGLTEKDLNKVLSGIDLCKQSEQICGSENQQGQFFAIKGQLKGWLGLCAISDDSHVLSNKERCSKLIKALNGQNVYEEAFSLRLKGRYFGILGDFENAQKNLTESAIYFDQMKEARFNVELSLQSIACHLEILRHGIANNVSVDNELNSVDGLEDFLAPFGGMLGEASVRIKEMVTNIRKSIDGRTINKEQSVAFLDRLIWFIEG
ncbi:cation transporter [Thermodesulfobacteriota bacterium]